MIETTVLLGEDYLTHHGVKGMKWGVRRYQNSDGSLTPKGKNREAKQAKPSRQERKQAEQAQILENTKKAAEAGYKPRSRAFDVSAIGERPVREIEKRIASGTKIDTARREVRIEEQKKTRLAVKVVLAGFGAYRSRHLLKLGADLAAAGVLKAAVNKQNRDRAAHGAKMAAEVLSRTKGVSAANVIDLSYDAVSKSWK